VPKGLFAGVTNGIRTLSPSAPARPIDSKSSPAGPIFAADMPFDFCIPTRATAVPDGADWLHKIKYDGCRHV
jgi:hypothetical protein